MIKLLIIDDEQAILECFRYGFPAPEFEVATARTAQAGIDAFVAAPPDVVLLDVRLPDLSGLEAFEKLHRIDPKTPVILMTGHGTAATAIEAMRMGAFDYILKPLDVDVITDLIVSAAETNHMMRTPARLPADGETPDDGVDLLVGKCAAMQEVYRSIGRVAPKDVTALILGESGTGKEVVARAIYQYSQRADEKFLAINCAAIPEQLLESELFGHEKGSFTGADRKRIGKFELASDGTLFLDEIGDMTPLMQTKILRVLQDQTFERVGGSETVTTRARLIAATNRDLEQAIADGEFRSDLFYRLNVYTIHLPPLRERHEDLPLLVEHFLRRFGKELGRQVEGVAPEALALLTDYAWPGNVRELQSVVKHALLEATGPVIVPAFLPPSVREGRDTVVRGHAAAPETDGEEPPALSAQTLVEQVRARLAAGSHEVFAEVVGDAEREVIAEVIRATGGNLTQAAKRLGISRTTLRSKLASLGISVELAAHVDRD
ncbi:MAG: sigma-54-dependent Fis family transcriptional regulator [Planctomycetales bacterium]|nr:sigma-54-dependent Fis family transcriptional regulator [Planctomycetales bacterium]